MRRESSTVVALVGEVDDVLLAEIARYPNVSVARPPSTDQTAVPAGGTPSARAASASAQPAGTTSPESRPGWEAGALALREAARRRSTYVIVSADPLADVATRWRAMWDLSAGQAGSADFEVSAAEALAAWGAQRFDLPDYYLVVAPAQHADAGPDLYLGPMRAARPRRVAVAAVAGNPGQAAHLMDTLRSLEHGPWWPPLDELLDAARRFYADDLGATADPHV